MKLMLALKMRLTLFLMGMAMICSGELPGQEPERLDYLFESGTEGYACFRIPAIVTTFHGTVLAFPEPGR